MARLFHHSFPGAKAAFFLLEQALVLVFVLMGAPLVALLLLEEGGGWALGGGPLALQQVALHLVLGVAHRLPGATSWALFTVACCALAMYAVELYDLRQAVADRSRGSKRTFIALGLVAAGLAVRAAAGGLEEWAFAGGALLAAALAVAASRRGIPSLLGPPIRILVLGTRDAAAQLAAGVAGAEVRVEIVGVWEGLEEEAGDDPVDAARATGAEWLVVAQDRPLSEREAAFLVSARVAGLQCLTPTTLHERLVQKIPVEALRAHELAFSDGFTFASRDGWGKRALDVCLASMGLILAAPLLLVAAVAIRLDSPGPILYRQERVGRWGRRFDVIKLRTMRQDAEVAGKPQWAQEADPRTTRVGRLLRRTRIDEIPQLWSVLKGEMSFVGPRPERPFFVGWLEEEIPWYPLRHAARPGLTGWAQLKFPYGASVEDAKRKLEYDLYYLKNASIFLDVAIVFHTVRHVLLARGSR